MKSDQSTWTLINELSNASQERCSVVIIYFDWRVRRVVEAASIEELQELWLSRTHIVDYTYSKNLNYILTNVCDKQLKTETENLPTLIK